MVLGQEYFDEAFVRTSGPPHLGEDVLIFQRALVVLLAEFASEPRRVSEG